MSARILMVDPAMFFSFLSKPIDPETLPALPAAPGGRTGGHFI